jgi:hypothetical protein
MCDVKHCRKKDVEITYYGHNVCLSCWMKHSNEKINLKKEFKIEG